MGSVPGRVTLGRVALGSLALLMVACGGGDQSPSVAVVSDSAGVRIVDHGGVLPDGPVWSIEMGQALELPGDFHRVGGGVVLDRGAVVVGDGASRELRSFTPGGDPGRVVGGEGEGPGEFMAVTLLDRWPGDSIAVFDVNLRRVSLFDGDLNFGRTFALEVSDEAPFGNIHGVLDDGTMVASGFSRLPDGGPQTGVRRYPSPLHVYDSGGGVRVVGFAELWTESYFDVMGGGAFSIGPVPFASAIRPAFGRDRIVLGESLTGELRIFDSDGALRGIVRGTGPMVRLDAEARRAGIDRALDGTASALDAGERRRQLEALELPEHQPILSRVGVDRDGFLWMAPYSGTRWTVFDGAGGFLAHIDLPEGIRPLEIGTDYLLAMIPDAFDVERIYRIPLERR